MDTEAANETPVPKVGSVVVTTHNGEVVLPGDDLQIQWLDTGALIVVRGEEVLLASAAGDWRRARKVT